MEIINIPQDVLALICSFTDDTSVFNLACTCRIFHGHVNDAKNKIIDLLHRKDDVCFNVLNVNAQQVKSSMSTVESIISENIGYVQHYHTISSHVTSKVHTSMFEVPPKGDFITSIKLKGDIVSLVMGFEGASQLHKHTDISCALMKILPHDCDEYVEILSLFCPFTPTAFQQMLIRVGFRGTMQCKITYIKLDKHHQQIIQRGDLCMNMKMIRTSRIFVEDWTYWRTPMKKVVFFPASQGTKGIAITISHYDSSISNDIDKDMIEYIDVSHTNNQEVKSIHRLSGRKLFANNIIRKKWYNLPFELKKCWYVPMQDYSYHPKYGTIFNIKFKYIPGNIRIEGIYFTSYNK